MALQSAIGSLPLPTTDGGTGQTVYGISTSSSGYVTMSSQPSFLAYLTANFTNATGNGGLFLFGNGTYSLAYNRASAMATIDGLFTAPVAGIYDLRACFYVSNTTIATTFTITIFTTTRNYSATYTRAASNTDQSVALSVLADMSALDLAQAQLVVSGEAANTVTISGGTTAVTYFCGTLVA